MFASSEYCAGEGVGAETLQASYWLVSAAPLTGDIR